MLNHPSLDKLRHMKLDGMAQAFQEQLELKSSQELSFEERLGLLIDREMTHRDNRRFDRRLKNAKLKQPASLEDIDFKHPRNLDSSLLQSLSSCQWIKDRLNLLISGPTGVGKSYLSSALALQACRHDYAVLYTQTAKLLQDLAISKGDGRYPSRLSRLAKIELLILDDWGLDTLTTQQQRILLELLDDRYQKASTLIASQFHPNLWHELLASPTLADAILDRVIHNAYRINLKGESLRKTMHSLTDKQSIRS
jgi:DNA replication protein DnaC